MTESLINKYNYVQKYGYEKASKKFKVKIESLKRECRRYRQHLNQNNVESTDNTPINKEQSEKEKLSQQLIKKFSKEELQSLINSKYEKQSANTVNFNTPKKSFWFLFMTDTHMGGEDFDEDFYKYALELAEQHNCLFMVHGGDITEGINPSRLNQIFSLKKRTYKEQVKYAVEMLELWKKPIFLVDGNHDRWAYKALGCHTVEDICERLPNATFLGNDNGILKINDLSIHIRHGEDAGGAYALSYRLQKFVESISPINKPDIILTGHTHKYISIYEKDIFCVSGGALCHQSAWMKSTNKTNHTGFCLINIEIDNNSRIKSFIPKFVPYDYSKPNKNEYTFNLR